MISQKKNRPPKKSPTKKNQGRRQNAHRGNMRSSENCITMRQRSDPYHVAGDQVSSPWKVPQLGFPPSKAWKTPKQKQQVSKWGKW